MRNVPVHEIIFNIGNLIAVYVLLARLLWTGLARSYPALTVYLAVQGVAVLIPWALRMDVTGWLYVWEYMISEILYLFLFVVMVLELYSSVLRDLTGIASVARRFVNVSILVSIAGSLLLFEFEKHPRYLLERFFVIDRVIVSSLLLFVLSITAFVVWFPVRVPVNAVAYSIGYALYLLPRTAALMLQNSGYFWRIGGLVAMPASMLVLFFWAVVLSRRGEKSTISIGPSWNPQDEMRIMAELAGINRKLLRSGRRESV